MATQKKGLCVWNTALNQGFWMEVIHSRQGRGPHGLHAKVNIRCGHNRAAVGLSHSVGRDDILNVYYSTGLSRILAGRSEGHMVYEF
jgi:hypothetical protein